jgi:hypothetical protein
MSIISAFWELRQGGCIMSSSHPGLCCEYRAIGQGPVSKEKQRFQKCSSIQSPAITPVDEGKADQIFGGRAGVN